MRIIYTITAVLMSSTACQEVDRRNAEVIVGDNRLVPNVAEAISFWQYATGNNISAVLTDQCELGIKKSCVVIRSGNIDNSDGATRTWTRAFADHGVQHGAWVTVEIKNNANYNKFIVAHEIGHALGISHVSEKTELMYHRRNNLNWRACIKEKTIAAYERVYGNCSGCREVCLIEE